MWKALTDIFPFLCTQERFDHAVFPGIRVLLPWWVRKMNSSFFFLARIQSCSCENALKSGNLHSTFCDSRDLEVGERNLHLNHDVIQLCTAHVCLGQAPGGRGWIRYSLLVIIKFSLVRSDLYLNPKTDSQVLPLGAIAYAAMSSLPVAQ